MGSGQSGLTPSVVYEEAVKEYEHVKASHEDTLRMGAIGADHLETLENAFKDLVTKVDRYVAIYKSKQDRSDAEIQKAFLEAETAHLEYKTLRRNYVIELGDIVSVKDPVLGMFVEALVYEIHDGDVSVKIQSEEEWAEPENWSKFKVGSPSIRKLRSWDHLEPGDRVRVKEGCLFFQAVVVAVSSDGSEVTVSYHDEFDTHRIGEDDEEKGERNENEDEDDAASVDEDMEDSVEVIPRSLVEKIDTGRIARLKLKDAVKRVQRSIFVSNAFRNHDGTSDLP